MGSHSSDPPAAPDPVPASVRAQLLATEHWGLLAARGTAQNEVLTRIAIFFTLLSAGLVSLALIGQVTDFAEAFSGFSLGIIGFVCFVGFLTQMRVFAVGMEDLMYVVAMNRLRGAYDELDPGIAKYFMASTRDDQIGSIQTYFFFLPRRSNFAQVLASSMIFVTVVNGALLGLFAGALTMSLGGHPVAAVVVGVVVGIVWMAGSAFLGQRHYQEVWTRHVPLFPS